MQQPKQHDGFWIEASLLGQRFGISDDTLSAAVASGRVRTRQERGVELYAVADLDAWLRGQPQHAGPFILRATLESTAVQRQLERANYLAQMGTMAMSVGHEINNPLTYVISNSEYILEDILPRLRTLQRETPETRAVYDELKMLLNEIDEGAEHIRRVVDELGILARSATDITQVYPGEAIKSALRMVGPALNSSVSLTHHVSVSRPISINASLLVQVLINLLTNAVHAVQGIVDPHIEVRCFEGSGHAIIEIGDNGSGIRPELLGRIFDPFFTTKPVGEGTGLGLAVCRKLVERMSGAMTLSSSLGKGTTVRVSIPLSLQPTEAAESAPEVDASRLRGAKIIVVDDDSSVLGSLVRTLSSLGLEIATESSARRALSRIQANDYDLILSDLMMPSMTGMTLYREVMRHCPEKCSRFVFMSGGPSTEEARAFSTAHAERLLTKPISEELLTRALLARRLKAGVAVEPCPNISRCPMFPKFQSDHMLQIYKVIYCEPRDGAHRRCARYRVMKSGSMPSAMLLPNGEELPE